MTAPSSSGTCSARDTLVHAASLRWPARRRCRSARRRAWSSSPDGRYVAFPSADDVHFQIRDVATGALGSAVGIEDGFFMSFSPDGERYVTVDDDWTATSLGSGDRRASSPTAKAAGGCSRTFHDGNGRVHAGRARTSWRSSSTPAGAERPRRARRHDARTGRRRARCRSGPPAAWSRVTPDGRDRGRRRVEHRPTRRRRCSSWISRRVASYVRRRSRRSTSRSAALATTPWHRTVGPSASAARTATSWSSTP